MFNQNCLNFAKVLFLKLYIYFTCYFINTVPLSTFLNGELGVSGEARFLVLELVSLLTNLQLEAETVSRRVRSEFDVESSLSPLPE